MLIEFQLSADSVGEDRLSELEGSVEELRGEVQEKEAELDQRERELVEGRDRITALENQILEYATIINDQTKVCEGLLCILVNFFSPSLCLFVPSVSLFLTSSFLFSVFFFLIPPPLSLSLFIRQYSPLISTHSRMPRYRICIVKQLSLLRNSRWSIKRNYHHLRKI